MQATGLSRVRDVREVLGQQTEMSDVCSVSRGVRAAGLPIAVAGGPGGFCQGGVSKAGVTCERLCGRPSRLARAPGRRITTAFTCRHRSICCIALWHTACWLIPLRLAWCCRLRAHCVALHCPALRRGSLRDRQCSAVFRPSPWQPLTRLRGSSQHAVCLRFTPQMLRWRR